MAKALQRANGTGAVYKLSGKRRNPWRAVKTMGWVYDDDKEKLVQNRVTVGYYHTKDEAILALSNYNENPYDIKTDSITFSETYERWSEEYFPTLTQKSSVRTVTAAYKHCTPLYNMRMKDIRVVHLEGVIKDADVGNATKGRIKSLFNLIYRYAMRHEIVDKDYAQLCNAVKRDAPQKEMIPFSPDEIQQLWDHVNDVPFVDMILIGIYSGWRPQELAILKTGNIDLKEQTMQGGMKTNAGKNRIVPIHPRILSLIEERYNPENEFLFNDENCTHGVGKQLTYDKYRNRFNKVMDRLKLNHRPHEARHTFITMAKSSHVDEYIYKTNRRTLNHRHYRENLHSSHHESVKARNEQSKGDAPLLEHLLKQSYFICALRMCATCALYVCYTPILSTSHEYSRVLKPLKTGTFL